VIYRHGTTEFEQFAANRHYELVETPEGFPVPAIRSGVLKEITLGCLGETAGYLSYEAGRVVFRFRSLPQIREDRAIQSLPIGDLLDTGMGWQKSPMHTWIAREITQANVNKLLRFCWKWGVKIEPRAWDRIVEAWTAKQSARQEMVSA